MKTLILIIAALVLSSIAYSEVDEDCLVEPMFYELAGVYTYEKEFFSEFAYNHNTDSLLLDTCSSYPGNWIYYGKIFRCSLTMNIFPRDSVYEFDPDSVYKKLYYTKNDLPSEYQYLYDELDSLEILFGEYEFIDLELTFPDTTDFDKRFLGIEFKNYYKLDQLTSRLKQLSFMDSLYFEMPSYLSTSVENRDDMEVFIYPNPATDILEIKTDLRVLQVKILDINGRVVIESENNDRIDIKHLISGIYFLKINDKYFHKFIKE